MLIYEKSIQKTALWYYILHTYIQTDKETSDRPGGAPMHYRQLQRTQCDSQTVSEVSTSHLGEP